MILAMRSLDHIGPTPKLTPNEQKSCLLCMVGQLQGGGVLKLLGQARSDVSGIRETTTKTSDAACEITRVLSCGGKCEVSVLGMFLYC